MDFKATARDQKQKVVSPPQIKHLQSIQGVLLLLFSDDGFKYVC